MDHEHQNYENFDYEVEASQTHLPIDKILADIQTRQTLDTVQTLRHFLSPRAILPSSTATEQRRTKPKKYGQYRTIGAGTCGRIFEVSGTPDIFKTANHPGKETDQLWNDYVTHVKVCEVFDKLRDQLDVHVPRVRYFANVGDDRFWQANLDKFPEPHRERSNLLCAERIPPLAEPIRDALIDQYCPKDGVLETKQCLSNRDCLARVYLGRRRARPSQKFFKLRNFNLCLNQFEELGLDPLDFAFPIADALAILHWVVHTDADDVEFVLGSAPHATADPTQITVKPLSAAEVAQMAPNTSTWDAHYKDFKSKPSQMWLLDFNRCKAFQPNDSGLQHLVQSFLRTDPYYPLPRAEGKDEGLWNTFRDRYVSTAGKHVEAQYAQMPARFMDMVVEEFRKRREQYGTR